MTRLAALFIACFLPVLALAQVAADTLPPTGDTLRLLEIINADKQGYKKTDSATELQLLVGRVQVRQGKTTFTCDSAVYIRNNQMLEAFGNVHINDADSIHTYGQYLQYFTGSRMAFMKKKVRLTDGKSNLYTDDLSYDVNQKIGAYHNKGRFETGTTRLSSTHATYYADLKDVYFMGNVVLKDPQYDLTTDSLLYNTNLDVATFISPTVIIDSSKRKIKTREGFYDRRNKKAFFSKRPVIEDGAVTVTANEIDTNDSSGVSNLKGNAVYKDTAQNVAILANRIEANQKEGSFKATLHPLMILKQDGDSLFLTADTLYSGKLSARSLERDSTLTGDSLKKGLEGTPALQPTDSTDRYILAFPHVRIFSDSLQAVADSLFYSSRDSIFQLFRDPIVWSNDNQVTGDTIYLYTRNKKADRLFVFENGMLVNKAGENLYNQIRGNRLNGYFKEGVIDYMRARGNAESIYYIKDEDSSMVGINKASGDIIELRFNNKELNKVLFISEVKGVMYPFSQFPESERRLRNFQWQLQRRPMSRAELFED